MVSGGSPSSDLLVPCATWKGIAENGAKCRGYRKREKKGRREENKVGQTEHAECRLGLTPALPLIHLSSFLFAHFRASCLSVFYSAYQPLFDLPSSCGLTGTLEQCVYSWPAYTPVYKDTKYHLLTLLKIYISFSTLLAFIITVCNTTQSHWLLQKM